MFLEQQRMETISTTHIYKYLAGNEQIIFWTALLFPAQEEEAFKTDSIEAIFKHNFMIYVFIFDKQSNIKDL